MKRILFAALAACSLLFASCQSTPLLIPSKPSTVVKPEAVGKPVATGVVNKLSSVNVSLRDAGRSNERATESLKLAASESEKIRKTAEEAFANGEASQTGALAKVLASSQVIYDKLKDAQSELAATNDSLRTTTQHLDESRAEADELATQLSDYADRAIKIETLLDEANNRVADASAVYSERDALKGEISTLKEKLRQREATLRILAYIAAAGLIFLAVKLFR